MAGGHKSVPRKKDRSGRQGRAGTVLIVIGLVLIAVAIGIFAYNEWDSHRAGEQAEAIVEQFDDEPDATDDDGQQQAEAPTKSIDGQSYLGVLEIPSLGITLPVANDWDYGRLRVSPCRYTGSYLTDDLVICGHNYPSHFRGLLRIAIGADVYLDTADGSRVHYIVSNRETVQPTSIEQMVENDHNSDSSYDWDLTLFTCNLGGQTRCAVRCVREDA